MELCEHCNVENCPILNKSECPFNQIWENDEDLIKELEARGTAEVINSVVTQVTQALVETEDMAIVLLLGEIQIFHYIPIEKACSKCNHVHFGSIDKCRERQRVDARSRGFTKVICPDQLKERRHT